MQASLRHLRSLGLIPHFLLAPAAFTANTLTVIAMAALGLGTDLKTVAGAGPRVIAAVTASLALLMAMSFALIRAISIA